MMKKMRLFPSSMCKTLYWKFALSLLVAAAILPAASPPAQIGTGNSLPDFVLDAPRTPDADDVGRFLAGLPGRPGSPFAGLERSDAWIAHRRELDQLWSGVESRLFPAIHKFQRKELGTAPLRSALVFYPFSGPDALMLTLFFPDSPAYVMVGLEPAGTLPAPKRLIAEDLGPYLTEMRAAIYSELHRSFFITRQMDRQFRGQVTDGLLTPIIELLARTNHNILGIRCIRLNEKGEVVVRSVNYRAPGHIGNKGVEIDFRSDSDQLVHRLYYFSVNLSDERLRENPPFLTFLSRLDGMTTFLKATSYMPHQSGFSMIRALVEGSSAAILQDDSGIPYRFFDPKTWNVQLYGAYDRPYGSFKGFEQQDLKAAYATSAAKPLTFRIGYGFSRIPSNLLLATRRRARRTR